MRQRAQGEPLDEAHKKHFLGNNVNFNGLKLVGRGKIVIGDNCHSGEDILFITDNHDYDHGTAIPYDDTHVALPITIEDNV